MYSKYHCVNKSVPASALHCDSSIFRSRCISQPQLSALQRRRDLGVVRSVTSQAFGDSEGVQGFGGRTATLGRELFRRRGRADEYNDVFGRIHLSGQLVQGSTAIPANDGSGLVLLGRRLSHLGKDYHKFYLSRSSNTLQHRVCHNLHSIIATNNFIIAL